VPGPGKPGALWATHGNTMTRYIYIYFMCSVRKYTYYIYIYEDNAYIIEILELQSGIIHV
jgi:hypothetical protein